MEIVLFEDSKVQQLAPITTGRPAYAVTCATYRLVDWITAGNSELLGSVRDHLIEIQKLDYHLPQFSSPKDPSKPTLFINARIVPEKKVTSVVQQILNTNRPVRVDVDGELALAFVPFSPRSASTSRDSVSLASTLHDVAAELPLLDTELRLFHWPHDVVSENMRLMSENLEHRLKQAEYTEIQAGVFLARGAKLGEFASIDTSHGPILLDEDVQVGPFCYLSGPVYAGPRTRVIEHAALKDAVSLGHTVKIGGEVEASIIEPYSNKQHHGFLGHSYLGSWINLGAGTCNSDLKNTYGLINMQYGSNRVPTNMQFMGCIMGDYTKTAINTGIFTGKVVGVCSMLYGFVTSNVPSFVNYARLFGQTAELPPDVMIATQQRMFSRRKVAQRACDQQLIRDMHRFTEAEREGQLGQL